VLGVQIFLYLMLYLNIYLNSTYIVYLLFFFTLFLYSLLLLHLSIYKTCCCVLRFKRMFRHIVVLAKSSYRYRCKAAFRGASPRICGSRQIQYFLRAAFASVYHSLRAKIPELYRITFLDQFP